MNHCFSRRISRATTAAVFASVVCLCAPAEEGIGAARKLPTPSPAATPVAAVSVPAYLAPMPVAPAPSGDAAPSPAPSPDGMLPVEGLPFNRQIAKSVQPGVPYAPLTTREKARFQLLSTFQPSTLTRIGFTAGLATLRDSPNEWPRTVETYNWRFADRVGQRLVFKSTEFLVGSVLLHEDPRYFLAEKPGTVAKLKNALKQTWMTRRDNGAWAPAWGSFAGAYSAGFVSAQWMPESRQTAEGILIRSSSQIGFRFCNNLLREFGPALKKKFRR